MLTFKVYESHEQGVNQRQSAQQKYLEWKRLSSGFGA
jgi:hypothetical protein